MWSMLSTCISRATVRAVSDHALRFAPFLIMPAAIDRHRRRTQPSNSVGAALESDLLSMGMELDGRMLPGATDLRCASCN